MTWYEIRKMAIALVVVGVGVGVSTAIHFIVPGDNVSKSRGAIISFAVYFLLFFLGRFLYHLFLRKDKVRAMQLDGEELFERTEQAFDFVADSNRQNQSLKVKVISLKKALLLDDQLQSKMDKYIDLTGQDMLRDDQIKHLESVKRTALVTTGLKV